MAVNLSRNTKVYFTTVAGVTGFTNDNTKEIQVLDGYSFSQGTEQQTIQINEAGATPNRGQRAFNTQLNPVDWNFGAYIRPTLTGGRVTAIEKYLWNAIAGSQALVEPVNYLVAANTTVRSSTALGAIITVNTTLSHNLFVGDTVSLSGFVETGFNGEYRVATVVDLDTFTVISTTTSTGTTTTLGGTVANCPWYDTATFSRATFLGSNKHQLATFALIFKVDNTFYKVNNCAINQAEVSFDIAGISQIAWSGFGTSVIEITDGGVIGQLTGLTAASTTADFITNKLSTVTFVSNIEGTAGTTYSVPITGGTLTINNNLEYLTPEILGVVNQSIGYYTGSRAISGTLNAYLRTGTAGDTASLLAAILASSQTSTETKYKIQVEVGGLTNIPRVELLMNGCQVQVPTVDIQDVISTTINFTAQGYTEGSTTYDIEKTNDLRVTYFGKAPG